ncbi:MAG: bacterial transcriptional activator domain-containing protein, partial [Actinomycetota bacterium]
TAQELHEMAEDAARAERAADEAAAGPGASDQPPVVAEPVQGAAPDGSAPDGPDPGDQQPEGVPAGALAVAAGGALMATGLLGLLARARRLRLSETGEASVPAPPPIDLVDIETVLRNRADSAAVDALADAVASLAAGHRRSDQPVPVPEVVRVAGSRIEAIVADTTAPIPAPWRPVDVAGSTLPPNRRAVVAEAGDLGAAGTTPGTGTGTDAATGENTRPSAGLAPTLVNVGDGLLINLEAIGVVELRGRSDSASALARSIVHELGSVSMAIGTPPVDVIVSEALADAGLGVGSRSSSPERMLADLEPWLEETELALAASGADGPSGLRLAGGTAGASPVRSTVVVVEGAELAADGPLAGLIDRANDRRLPLAVLAVGPVPTGGTGPSMTISADQERVRLEPLGMAAVALDLDLDLVLGVEALIDHARRAPIVPRPELTWAEAEFDADPDADRPTGALSSAVANPAQAPTEETPEHDIATERPSDDEGEEVTDRSDDRESGLLIRVLGPVEVEGGPSDLSEREVAILAFLALAGPSSTDQIVDAIAPGRPDERAGVEADLVGLNARLGPLFPQAGDGRHRVRSTITDLGSARRWVAQASALSEERARNLLQLALSEVRGRPFDGIDRRSWQWIEDHRLAIATQATSLLMDACFDLCDSAYEADDLHLSLWACTVGSLIDPLQETAVTRQVQLLVIMGRPDEAAAVVDRWEQAFASAAGRPAPHGPRLALGQPLGAAESAAAPPDGPGPSPADQEVATHVG